MFFNETLNYSHLLTPRDSMSTYKKSLAEIFGKKVLNPPQPIDTTVQCPFLGGDCKKSAGIDDVRIRPSGACSIWFNCQFLNPPKEIPIIICPNRFYTKNYYHLWSLVQKMIKRDMKTICLIPEVANMDWVIYSNNDEVLGAIEVQSMDTTGSYKNQLLYLRGIPDPKATQYPKTVNANWANATYKRFYPQIVETIAIMDQFNAPVGLLSQDIFAPYLRSRDRFPLEETKGNPEVIWSFLTVDHVIGTTDIFDESHKYFTKSAIKDAIRKFTYPNIDAVVDAISRQIESGKAITYG